MKDKICPYCGSKATHLTDNVTDPLNPTYLCDTCDRLFTEKELKEAYNICKKCTKDGLCKRQASFYDHDQYVISCDEYDEATTGLDPEWTFNQSAKADAGKAPLTLVPLDILFDISRVREYGNKKYGDPDNWKTVEVERYRDAFFRHWCAYLQDPYGLDEESGLPHLWHCECNLAFIAALEKDKFNK